MLYGVGYHMSWTTVVHTIYNLLSTAYIWCGDMLWVHMSSTDERIIGTRLIFENDEGIYKPDLQMMKGILGRD